MSRPQARLSRSISFRLSEADFARIAYQAAAADMRVNELSRMRTLARDNTSNVTVTKRTDPALIAQLIAIGNNLNQMVKRFHMTGRVSPHLEALCQRINRIIDNAIETDGGA